jgi:hypothetical protein
VLWHIFIDIANSCHFSSLVLRFVKDQFDDYRESTIGGKSHVLSDLRTATHACVPPRPFAAAFLTQTVSLDEQTTIKFEIW